MLYKTKLGMTDELLTCREREIEEDDKCMLICSEIARRKEIQACNDEKVLRRLPDK
jgi:hypothetical protein